MIRRAWCLFALAAPACVSEPSMPEPKPGVQPRTCAATVAITGTASSAPTAAGTYTLDANGATICAHLDATQLTRAHFAAATGGQSGSSSGLAATLEAADGTTIVEGWDVTYGASPPETHLNVEWSPPAGKTTDVVVWLRAPTGAKPAALQLWLFDPLE